MSISMLQFSLTLTHCEILLKKECLVYWCDEVSIYFPSLRLYYYPLFPTPHRCRFWLKQKNTSWDSETEQIENSLFDIGPCKVLKVNVYVLVPLSVVSRFHAFGFVTLWLAWRLLKREICFSYFAYGLTAIIIRRRPIGLLWHLTNENRHTGLLVSVNTNLFNVDASSRASYWW